MAPVSPRFVTAASLARTLGLTRILVQTWCRTGKVLGYKRGNSWRISLAEVERLVSVKLTIRAGKKRARKVKTGRRRYSLPAVTAPGGIRAQWDAELDARLDAANRDDEESGGE